MRINIWQDDRGFYWQRGDTGDRNEPLVGPFQTRESAKWDAGSVLYVEAGKEHIRFVEGMFES